MFDQFLAEVSKPAIQVDLIKILLDKGLLAILLAGLALAAAILVERVKASLLRQQEILKITAPLVLKLLESCDELYEAGITTLRSKAESFTAYEDWAINLTSAFVSLGRRMSLEDIPYGTEARQAELKYGGQSVRLVVHLKAYAPNSAIADLVDSDLFWQQDSVVSKDGSLVRHLYMTYIAKSEITEASVQFQMARVYAALKLGKSKGYTAALFKFRQDVIRDLYPGNEAQLKSIEGLLKLLEHNSQAFEDFPILDVGRARILGSSNTTTTFEVLAQNHAQMVGLIGQYLRSH